MLDLIVLPKCQATILQKVFWKRIMQIFAVVCNCHAVWEGNNYSSMKINYTNIHVRTYIIAIYGIVTETTKLMLVIL